MRRHIRVASKQELADRILATIDDIDQQPVGPAVLRTDGQAMLLTLESTTSVVPGTQEIRTRSIAEVEHAVIALAAGTGGPELIALAVPSLRFETVDAAAPTVDVSVGKLDFLGPLSWVATLAKLLENTGLGGLSQRTAARRPGRADAAAAADGNGTGVQATWPGSSWAVRR